MQIGATTLPADNLHFFLARRASFKCRGSLLNPIPTSKFHAQLAQPITSMDLTRQHLSNLDKVLKKQSEPDPYGPDPAPKNGSTGNTGKGLFESLNLGRLWPEMKAAEDVSPRHLNRLQRLLSKTPEYSPRNNLGSRWREYHGCNDWSGLLDPLDENLRREVVRYGEFIQAAYHCFHSDPATSLEESPSPRHVVLSDRSYRVTKSLYATSSVGLPKWVDDVSPDLGWMTQRSSWIGYVAVCDDKKEIARMGRRDIVIALRGTATCLEWTENFRAGLVQFPDGENNNSSEGEAKVAQGFLGLYKTRGAHVPSLSESVIEEVRRLVDLYKGETLSITVTGHSLGAALAILVGDELSTSTIQQVSSVAVFSFGGPHVGNRGFANRINAKKVKVLRIVNSQDLITRVPGIYPIGGLDTESKSTKSSSKVVDMLDNNMYRHVGTELRLDMKMSPYLKPNADVACCHDLEAYLHLVDGFSASNCPFRANAKRSLLRLLHDQRSNVKKLYTCKAKALNINLDQREDLAMSSCLPSPSS